MIAEDHDIALARPGDLIHPPEGELHRSLDWKGAFWASSGVPAGVLLTMGGIATVIGQPSWVVWIVSILMGFLQSFVYAEIAGLYPHKSGGASVYGAAAWLPYSKFVAPISVWCNWLAWSPVLTLGTSLAAGYIMASLFPPTATINTWAITLVNLDFIRHGLSLRINAVSLIGASFLLLTFGLQHHGAARAAYAQKILGAVCMAPLILVGLVPLITGDLPSQHLFPLLPLVHDAAGRFHFGTWGSSLNFKDGNEALTEVDLYGGYAGKIGDALSYDFGVTYYWYPGATKALNYDYVELFGKLDVVVASGGPIHPRPKLLRQQSTI